jgi:hypothetical protein
MAGDFHLDALLGFSGTSGGCESSPEHSVGQAGGCGSSISGPSGQRIAADTSHGISGSLAPFPAHFNDHLHFIQVLLIIRLVCLSKGWLPVRQFFNMQYWIASMHFWQICEAGRWLSMK